MDSYDRARVLIHCSIFVGFYCFTTRIELLLVKAYIWLLLPQLGPCWLMLACITLSRLLYPIMAHCFVQAASASSCLIIVLSWLLFLLTTIIGDPPWWVYGVYLIEEFSFLLPLCMQESAILIVTLYHRFVIELSYEFMLFHHYLQFCSVFWAF